MKTRSRVFSTDPDASGLAFYTVVLDDIVLHAIAMPGHAFGLVAEENSLLLIAPHLVVTEQIVGVLVSDGDAVASVGFQNVLLEDAFLDAPA